MPANPTNIPVTYTAADLLRYATGGMTTPEMHRLEKAAMEDPFLAEALEGFMDAVADQEAPAVIQQQLDRIDPPPVAAKAPARIVPVRRRQNGWLVAAAAALVLGGSWWLVQLGQQQSRHPETVAVAPPPEATTAAPAADSNTVLMNLAVDSPRSAQPQLADPQYQSPTFARNDANKMANANRFSTDTGNMPAAVLSAEAAPGYAEIATNPVPLQSTSNLKKKSFADSVSPENHTTIAELSEKKVLVPDRRSYAEAEGVPSYLFKGRLTDSQNNPLPYASVMISHENVGTYTDARGSFNLVSADSVLQVQARSLGYVSRNLQLKADGPEAKIILQEDEKLKNELAVTQTKRQQRVYDYRPTIVERDSIEGAVQPAVGFNNYDLYLSNNNRLNYQHPLGRQVQLRFDINQNGEATNITVVKSSGDALDNEAIRLLREGPKWKRKKGKTGKITVKF